MLDGLQTGLWIAAVGGTTIFVLKTLVLMFGGGADHGDADGPSDVDHGTNWAFQFLSVQSLATFAMGAGWMGLAARGEFATSDAQAIGVAALFGAALVMLMIKVMSKLRGLESSGTLNVKNALGQSGVVYLTVPQGGAGQVEVVVQGRIAMFDAVSSDAPLATGSKVRVQAIDQAGRLVVAPA